MRSTSADLPFEPEPLPTWSEIDEDVSDEWNGRLAVAADAATRTNPGGVFFYNTGNLANAPSVVQVGAVPDNVVFTPDGSRLLVANEGEPNSYGQPGSINPEGSISVIDVATLTEQKATFTNFTAQGLRDAGVRIYGPGATAAQDLEPEYIAVSPDGTKAYVTLQENNALAIVDLAGAAPTVQSIVSLGVKNNSIAGNGFDASDQNGPGQIQTYANIRSFYTPDGITAVENNGSLLLITANEGDVRSSTSPASTRRCASASRHRSTASTLPPLQASRTSRLV